MALNAKVGESWWLDIAFHAASGLTSTEHALPNIDGETYLRVKNRKPADVNGDGVVNDLDLVLVAQALGTNNMLADLNGDGVVNVFDLVFVAEHQ